jgi:RNA polymerase sigma-70 factor (sigma-E family)
MATRDGEFSEYVEQRRTHLRRVAYLLCGDVHRAEDLVQTALMKLYVAWNRVRRSGDVDAYARRILVNSGIDESRRAWRREAPGLDGLDPVADEGIADEDRRALMDALAELPPGQRQVVVLRYFLGLTIEETAADLGCSTGTVS